MVYPDDVSCDNKISKSHKMTWSYALSVCYAVQVISNSTFTSMSEHNNIINTHYPCLCTMRYRHYQNMHCVALGYTENTCWSCVWTMRYEHRTYQNRVLYMCVALGYIENKFNDDYKQSMHVACNIHYKNYNPCH